MEERRKSADHRRRGPQNGEARQFLVVAVDVRRIDVPRATDRDVTRDPREGETVDAERERADREGNETRRHGDAKEGDDDRAVNPQSRKTTSKDRGDSTAGSSRIDSVGRSRNAAFRSPTAEPIEMATRTRTIKANVATSKSIGT